MATSVAANTQVTKLPSSSGASSLPQPLDILDIMDVRDLAGYLKVQESTIYERLRFRAAGEPHPMPAHKMGGYWRFLKHEIDAWLLSLPRVVQTRKRKYVRKKEAA
jgi:Helix-turn-helix domain